MKRPGDGDYESWIRQNCGTNVNVFQLEVEDTVHAFSTVTIAAGDADIHYDSGVIVRFAYLDWSRRRQVVALDHAESEEKIRKREDREFTWDLASLAGLALKATPAGRFMTAAGLVVRHLPIWNPMPRYPGYYLQPRGHLVFRGVHTLSTE